MRFMDRSLPPGDRDDTPSSPVAVEAAPVAPPDRPGGNSSLALLEASILAMQTDLHRATQALLTLNLAKHRGDFQQAQKSAAVLCDAVERNPRLQARTIRALLAEVAPKEVEHA